MRSKDPTIIRDFSTESNVAAFVLHPIIKGGIEFKEYEETIGTIKYITSKVELKVEPRVGESQRVILALNQIAKDNPASYTFLSEKRDSTTDLISITVSKIVKNGVQKAGLVKGTYLVRLQVDGAESPLEYSIDHRYIKPTVDIR
jgi:hypothetical protein